MELSNLFSSIPSELPQELFETILSGNSFRMERLVSQGQVSPEDFWYEQNEQEWVLVLQGQAELEYEDGSHRCLAPGDSELIPAYKRHRVSYTSTSEQTIWLALFFSD